MSRECLRFAAQSITTMIVGIIGVVAAMYFVGNNLFAFMAFSISSIVIILLSIKIMTFVKIRKFANGS